MMRAESSAIAVLVHDPAEKVIGTSCRLCGADDDRVPTRRQLRQKLGLDFQLVPRPGARNLDQRADMVVLPRVVSEKHLVFWIVKPLAADPHMHMTVAIAQPLRLGRSDDAVSILLVAADQRACADFEP